MSKLKVIPLMLHSELYFHRKYPRNKDKEEGSECQITMIALETETNTIPTIQMEQEEEDPMELDSETIEGEEEIN